MGSQLRNGGVAFRTQGNYHGNEDDVGDDDNDEDSDDDSDDDDEDSGDIYIMMECLSVCVSRKMITSSWESPVTT